MTTNKSENEKVRKYNSKYFSVTIDERGCIMFNPKAEIHSELGCRVANELVSLRMIENCSSKEWYNACMVVMDCLVEMSDYLKTEIVNDICGNAFFHPKELEEVHGRGETKHLSFSEAKAYVRGYSDAHVKCSDIFSTVDYLIQYNLDKMFPKLDEK